MVTIIAGERGFNDYEMLCGFIRDGGTDISQVFTMGVRAPHSLGARWAFDNNIPHRRFPANMRKEMIEAAEDLIYVRKWKRYKYPKPELVQIAQNGGLEVYEYEF